MVWCPKYTQLNLWVKGTENISYCISKNSY